MKNHKGPSYYGQSEMEALRKLKQELEFSMLNAIKDMDKDISKEQLINVLKSKLSVDNT